MFHHYVKSSMIFGLLCLGGFLLFSYFPLDRWISDQLYNPATHMWLVEDERDRLLYLIFYQGLKKLVIVIGVSTWGLFFGSFNARLCSRFPALLVYRWQFLYIASCVTLVPLLVDILKGVFHVYCPGALLQYGGLQKEMTVMESMSHYYATHQGGRCFPASHASSGFALLSLYFITYQKPRRWFVLGGVLVLGSIMGFYKMANGDHFLSHTLVSLLLAWWVCYMLYALILKK